MKRTDLYINYLDELFTRNGRVLTLYSLSFLSGVVLLICFMLLGCYLFDEK